MPLLLHGPFPPMLYDTYGVKRGLRDKNGKGVLAGLTSISQVQGKKLVDGKELPCEGRLFYRGSETLSSRYGRLVLRFASTQMVEASPTCWSPT